MCCRWRYNIAWSVDSSKWVKWSRLVHHGSPISIYFIFILRSDSLEFSFFMLFLFGRLSSIISHSLLFSIVSVVNCVSVVRRRLIIIIIIYRHFFSSNLLSYMYNVHIRFHFRSVNESFCLHLSIQPIFFWVFFSLTLCSRLPVHTIPCVARLLRYYYYFYFRISGSVSPPNTHHVHTSITSIILSSFMCKSLKNE